VRDNLAQTQSMFPAALWYCMLDYESIFTFSLTRFHLHSGLCSRFDFDVENSKSLRRHTHIATSFLADAPTSPIKMSLFVTQTARGHVIFDLCCCLCCLAPAKVLSVPESTTDKSSKISCLKFELNYRCSEKKWKTDGFFL
jgi:hypothetical protein